MMKKVITLLTSLSLLLGSVSLGAFDTALVYADGNVWTQTSQGMYGGDIKALALSPNYGTDRIVYAGVSTGGVFEFTDGGITWSAVNNGLTGLLLVEALAISPNYVNDQTIYVAITFGGVFKSTNGGVSWSVINNGLTDMWVQALAISPNFSTDQTIFVGTQEVFQIHQWRPLGLPSTQTYPT